MDVLKLIFEHDLLLEKLSDKSDPRNKGEKEYSLEDFMKPIPTYSRFYITGTHLDEPRFGIDCIDKYQETLTVLDQAFKDYTFTTNRGNLHTSLLDALAELNIGDALVCHSEKNIQPKEILSLKLDTENGIRHLIPHLVSLLDNTGPVIFKEKAKDGYDIHIFSKINLYEILFNHLKPLLDDHLRFFNINGKKVKSERVFYFETYRIEKPPHGFQEVFEQTIA